MVELRVLREKVLSNCPPHEAFWLCNSIVVRNIYELRDTIKELSDLSFRYHVNDDHKKNDFAKWVAEVIKDEELAKRLEGVLDRQRYAEIICARIRELESAV